MAGTRHSARLASTGESSPKSEGKPSPQIGSKRKADDTASPQRKRERKAPKQQTLEETLEGSNTNADTDAKSDQLGDVDMREAAASDEGTDRPIDPSKAKNTASATELEKTTPSKQNGTRNQDDASEAEEMAQKADQAEAAANSSQNGSRANKKGDTNPDTSEFHQNLDDATGHDNGGVIEHAADREDMVASNILEKGIIYFFTRGRVGIEDPESVQDLQRTYFVLRPIPKGGKIGEGALEDKKVARLVAIPKKVLPKSGRDRFMVFIEKSGVSMKDLKEEFFQGSEYETKTTGVRQTPPVAPIGEGVYALTTTGRTSHLAYMLTIPKDLSEVQSDMGLRKRGSFITSLKNPTASGPAYASLPEKPDFPEGFIEDFAGRSWMPIGKSEYLDYPNAQLLLIGEGEDKFSNALEPTDKDQKQNKETPQEELEKLEGEDEIRVEHLEGDDTVFADLGISKNEYPDVMTTW